MAFKQESKLNQSLIKEVRSGKSSAYEQLYNVHAGRIYNLGLRFYAHSRIAAEELTRKVFIRAYEEINAYPPDVTFILWLRKLAVEEIRKGEIKRADETHQVSNIDEAVYSLADEDRLIFILNDIDKLDAEEITEITGRSSDEIKRSLEGSRLTLMEMLKVETLEDLDYKVNFIHKKPEPREELWDTIYNYIHKIATKDLKEEKSEVLNVGDAKLTLGEKIDKLKQEKKKKEVFFKPLGLTISKKALFTFILIILIAAFAVYLMLSKHNSWEVISLAGKPSIKGNMRNVSIETSTSLDANEYLSTDNSSRAVIKIERTGEVYLNPNSSVKKCNGSADIIFLGGEVQVVKPKGTEPLKAEIHSVKIEDYKNGNYSAEINKNGAMVYSTGSSLKLSSAGREVYLIPGHVIEIKPGGKLGIPYYQDASPEFVDALNNFVFDNKNDRLNAILVLSERNDALSLFNVIPLVDNAEREMVINKLHSLINIPADINPRQISDLNEEDLRRWLDRIEVSVQ